MFKYLLASLKGLTLLYAWQKTRNPWEVRKNGHKSEEARWQGEKRPRGRAVLTS